MNSAKPGFLRISATGARLACVLLLGILTACGGEAGKELPPQQWQGMEVRVEPRPSPLQGGTTEFLVMVTDARGKPAYNLIVSLRTGDRDPWVQAIEDGQVGVYRRGIKVEPGASAVLQVQIKGRDKEGVLRFPLQAQP
jgi:hypothetical protein